MLPTSKTPRTAAPEAKTGKIPPASAEIAQPHGAVPGTPEAPLAPIGPERLKALREAIRNGSYPTDDDVLGGLEQLLQTGRGRR